MNKRFKIGDRVRTTDFPQTVNEERGHRIGDTGTIVALTNDYGPEEYIVQFDRRQGMEQKGHPGCWTCRPDILEHIVQITPAAVHGVMGGLDEILLGEGDDETATTEDVTVKVYINLIHHEDERSGFIDGVWSDRAAAVAAAEAYTLKNRGEVGTWEGDDLISGDVWVAVNERTVDIP